MLIFDRFVFMHVPKTAGTFIREALAEELGPPVRELRAHTGWMGIPPQARGLPVLAYVRNPWDWYVSWYRFLTHIWLPQQPPDWLERNTWVESLLGAGADFPTMVRNACRNPNPPYPRVAGDDFYTGGVKSLIGPGLHSDLMTIGRYESLVDDLERFLAVREIPHDGASIERIRRRRPVNASDRRPYREYYDDDLRDLVGRSCSMLIDRFGYSF